MAEPTVAAHLSIGEVLGLLLEEFPDVTISKIRFLESQGLIEPERTPSGYRKFYEADVELLRLILREQREHFLPLRVIKDRIDSGQIEPTGDVVAKHPAGGGHTSDGTGAVTSPNHPTLRQTGAPAELPPKPQAPAPTTPTAPATASAPAARPSRTAEELAPTPAAIPRPGAEPSSPRLLPGVLVSRDELCAMAQVTTSQLAQLEEYGVLARRRGYGELYGEDAVEVAAAAGGLLRAGVDARHLRAWRTSVEREVGLFEQLVLPVLRQRNPQARGEAMDQVEELSALGAKLRAALMRTAVHQTFDR